MRHFLALDVPDDDALGVHLLHPGDAVVGIRHELRPELLQALGRGDVHVLVSLEPAARVLGQAPAELQRKTVAIGRRSGHFRVMGCALAYSVVGLGGKGARFSRPADRRPSESR